jgi:hypothetical protein
MTKPSIDIASRSFIVLSDIHADTVSLKAVLEAAWEPEDFAYRCFLGDAIGYGYDPIGVLNILADFDVCIRGNHELLAMGEVNPNWYNDRARRSIFEHDSKLTEGHRQFMNGLLENYVSGNIVLYHGKPESALEYIMSPTEARDVIERYPQYDLFFGGHLHIPYLVEYDKETQQARYLDLSMPRSEFILDLTTKKYLVTCPSTTHGRFEDALPGCCRLSHISPTRKRLEFVFIDK